MITKRCSDAERAGRLAKAKQFLAAADLIETLADDDDLVDAQLTLCVHAGIAGADVLCCTRLGQHSQGQSHREAIDLLARVDASLAKDLASLLDIKTRAGYGSAPSTLANRKMATRAATRLVRAAVTA